MSQIKIDPHRLYIGANDLFISDQIHLKPSTRLLWAEKWILPILSTRDAPTGEPAR